MTDIKIHYDDYAITHDEYKILEKKNREKLNVWLGQYYLNCRGKAIDDSLAAAMLALKDEFGFGTKREAKFVRKFYTILEAIGLRNINAEEIYKGMELEGIRIEYQTVEEYEKEKEKNAVQ